MLSEWSCGVAGMEIGGRNEREALGNKGGDGVNKERESPTRIRVRELGIMG
jgi:hypothetical protein